MTGHELLDARFNDQLDRLANAIEQAFRQQTRRLVTAIWGLSGGLIVAMAIVVASVNSR